MLRYLVLALLLCAASPVYAQTVPGAFHGSRWIWGVEGGLQGYAGDQVESWTMVAPASGAFLAWSANPRFAFPLRGGQEWANTAHEFELGGRYYLISEAESDEWRLAIGLNASWLYGSGNDRYTLQGDGTHDRWSWNLPVVAGRNLVDLLWAKAAVRYDPKHENITALLELSLTGAMAEAPR